LGLQSVSLPRHSSGGTTSIYTAAGAANRIQFVIGPEGHRFYADLSWKAIPPLLRD
jgi:hypothetical protein